MTTVPFAPSAADPAAALRLLERRFPATPVWFGPYTRNWWALSNDRLIEAETPRALGEAIAAAAEAPVRPAAPARPPARTRPPRRSGGAWSPPAATVPPGARPAEPAPAPVG